MMSLSHFGPFGQFGHVVHIGAGSGETVNWWKRLNPLRITLVEADPKHGADLRRLSAPNLNIVLRAVSADPARSEFLRMSFSPLSSLRAPTGVLAAFPGLQISARIPVEPLDPITLCQTLDLDTEYPNLLVLDAPGENFEILERLHGENWLKRFQSIILQDGCEELYQGAGTLSACGDILKSAGYDLYEHSGSDPFFRTLEANLDVRRQAFEEQISKVDAQCRALEAKLSEAEDHLRRKEEDEARQAEHISKAEAQCRALEVKLSEVENHLSRKKEEEAQQTARILALRIDLQDLQTQYEALYSEKKDQDALLLEVVNELERLVNPDGSAGAKPSRRSARQERSEDPEEPSV